MDTRSAPFTSEIDSHNNLWFRHPIALDKNARPAVLICVNRISFVLVLLFVLVSCDGLSPTDPLSGRSATLSGVVADSYGNVWGGVSIGIVHPARGVVASGLTDHGGRYSITRVNPGQYRVWLQLGRTGPGYFVGDIDLRDGHNTFDIVSR
jgi:hypothetical protein